MPATRRCWPILPLTRSTSAHPTRSMPGRPSPPPGPASTSLSKSRSVSPSRTPWKCRPPFGKSGVQTCVCFECRFSQHFDLIRSCIDEGLLGEIHYAEVDYYHGIGPWYGQYGWNIKKDFGGSSLLTAGCHALDGLLYFTGSQVEEVTSYSTRSATRFSSPMSTTPAPLRW